MNTLVKIDGKPYVRDINTMALMPVDDTQKNDYYTKQRLLKVQREEINKVNEKVNTLAEDVLEIKNLLKQLIKEK